MGYSCYLLQPYSFVIKIDFEKQILVNKKHKMKILQYDIVVNYAHSGKLIMVNSLETGTEKAYIKLKNWTAYLPQLKLWNNFFFLLIDSVLNS